MKDFMINTTAKVNGPTFMVVVWGATLLSCIFITARIFARIHTFRRLWTDDVLAMLAWLFLLAQAIIWHTQVEALYVQHQLITKKFLPTAEIMEEIRRVLHAQLLGLFFFMFSLWLLKASFLVFFRRIGCYLHPLNRWYWSVVVLVFASCAACLGDIDYKCLTKSPSWGYDHCTSFSAVRVQFRGFLINALLDIFSDVLITTLPIALLWNVRMPLSRKLKLMGLFSLTVVVAIFAAVRIAAVAQPHHYFDATWLWMWSLIESAAAIIVATLASLRQLYVKQDLMQSSSPSNNSSDVWTRENMRSFIPSRKASQQQMAIVHSSPVDIQSSNMRGKP